MGNGGRLRKKRGGGNAKRKNAKRKRAKHAKPVDERAKSFVFFREQVAYMREEAVCDYTRKKEKKTRLKKTWRRGRSVSESRLQTRSGLFSAIFSCSTSSTPRQVEQQVQHVSSE